MSKKLLGNLMKQAQMMQEKLAKAQEEAALRTVEASSGGGMVTVTANGKMEVLSIKIEKEAVDPADVEMLQDLVTAAVNEALKKAQEMMSEEMGKVTGGLGLPGMGGGGFPGLF
jgi:DNA-binding YbaB/EbfC family protein